VTDDRCGISNRRPLPFSSVKHGGHDEIPWRGFDHFPTLLIAEFQSDTTTHEFYTIQAIFLDFNGGVTISLVF
jgi:hypothetical protein